MEPRAFLELAGVLSQTAEPAHCRSAVSRAYYAAYHTGHQFITALACPVTPGRQAHEDVQHLLGICGLRDLDYAVARLADLQGLRVRADYGLHDERIEMQGTATAAVAAATDVIEAIEEVRDSRPGFEQARANLGRETRRRRTGG